MRRENVAPRAVAPGVQNVVVVGGGDGSAVGCSSCLSHRALGRRVRILSVASPKVKRDDGDARRQ
jgi:hypothetical protein